MSILALPIDLQEEILSLLSFRELARACEICQQWRLRSYESLRRLKLSLNFVPRLSASRFHYLRKLTVINFQRSSMNSLIALAGLIPLLTKLASLRLGIERALLIPETALVRLASGIAAAQSLKRLSCPATLVSLLPPNKYITHLYIFEPVGVDLTGLGTWNQLEQVSSEFSLVEPQPEHRFSVSELTNAHTIDFRLTNPPAPTFQEVADIILNLPKLTRVILPASAFRFSVNPTSPRPVALKDNLTEYLDAVAKISDRRVRSALLTAAFVFQADSLVFRTPLQSALYLDDNDAVDRILQLVTHSDIDALIDPRMSWGVEDVALPLTAPANSTIHTITTVVNYIIKCGRTDLLRRVDRSSVLHKAVLMKDMLLMELLVSAGKVPIDIQTEDGRTPLMDFVSSREALDDAMLDFFVSKGANFLKEEPLNHFTVIHQALRAHETHLEPILKRASAQANYSHPPGLLHLLTRHEFQFAKLQSIFELLKRYGPLDINGKDSRQETALLVACQTRSDKLIHVLLQYGADPNIVSDHDNDSPIHSILRRFRASSPANPQEHGQHLYDQSIIKQLMKHGADPNIKSRDGFSALDIATTKYDGKNLVLLLQRPNVQPAINK